MTLSIDVKLGTATNIVLYWWTIAPFVIFDSSDGLNTSSFTTCSITMTNNSSSSLNLAWTIGTAYDHAIQAWTTHQTIGTDIVKNFSVKTTYHSKVSRPVTYIQGPAHFLTPTYAYNWVDQGTHSVLTSQGASYDVYQAVTLVIGKTYTLKCDVKLVGSSSVFTLGMEQGTVNRYSQTFTAADGLNTNTYTTISISRLATKAAVYWALGYNQWWSNNNSMPSANDVYHIKNVSFSVDSGLQVLEDLTITGTMTAATKSFDIKHPDPDKPDYRLRHWCIESDKPGGMVMYTRQMKATKAQTITFEMPDWFQHLVQNVIIFCSPYEHFW